MKVSRPWGIVKNNYAPPIFRKGRTTDGDLWPFTPTGRISKSYLKNVGKIEYVRRINRARSMLFIDPRIDISQPILRGRCYGEFTAIICESVARAMEISLERMVENVRGVGITVQCDSGAEEEQA